MKIPIKVKSCYSLDNPLSFPPNLPRGMNSIWEREATSQTTKNNKFSTKTVVKGLHFGSNAGQKNTFSSTMSDKKIRFSSAVGWQQSDGLSEITRRFSPLASGIAHHFFNHYVRETSVMCVQKGRYFRKIQCPISFYDIPYLIMCGRRHVCNEIIL